MRAYEFVVVMGDGLDPSSIDFETRFHDAGCDDATISFQKGRTLVDFTREAGTAAEAIASALADIGRASARAIRVEPDPLVTMYEISRRTGMAASTKVNGDGFPPPVACVTTDHPLWDWASVASWLYDRGRIDNDALEMAVAIRDANRGLPAN